MINSYQPLRLWLALGIIFAMGKRNVGRRVDGPARNTATSTQEDSLHEEINLGDVDPSAEINVPKWESRPHPKPSKFKLSKKKAASIVAIAFVGVIGFFGFKAIMASQRIVTKNSTGGAPVLNGDIDPTKLKGEGDGRINILMLGIGGAGHDGGTLSDTIMVASIDPRNKTVAMLSIPRDLYVKIPKNGYSKINSANSYGGPDLTKEVVSEVIDLPIHYYVQADFSGFKQAVDAVGGVDVNNETKLVDTSYPCDNNRGFCPFVLPAGQQHLDGKTALKYARCRHGSCGNDFGRADRQQELLVALREKALQASTLTNPVKVAKLIDSVGDHVRTDMQPAEIEKLTVLIKDIDTSKAAVKVLSNAPDGLLVDGSTKFSGAGYILIPRAGAFDYTEIQELAHSIFIDSYLKEENALVEVSSVSSVMTQSILKQLKVYNYNAVASTTPAVGASKTRVIDYTGGKKPYTVQYLERRFRVKAERATRESADSQQSQPDVAIIAGSDYKVKAR